MFQTQQNFAEVANFYIGVTLLDMNGDAYRLNVVTDNISYLYSAKGGVRKVERKTLDSLKPQLRPFYSITQQEAVELAIASGEYDLKKVSSDARNWTKHVFIDLNQVVIIPNTAIGCKPYIIGLETRYNSKQFAMLCKNFVDVFGLGKGL